jgi:branched-chain amino acid transport system ATP-binding protein
MGGTAILRVDGVSKRFGGLRAVDGVSAEVRDGEIFGIIGPNGAGKTTLFHLIAGFHAIDEGSVHLRDRRIDHLPPNRRAALGLLRTFQVVKPLVGMTVLENIMVGCFLHEKQGHAARLKAGALVDMLGLGSHRDQLAGKLPIGLRKRVEIARAMGADPKVLLLDEPFGGLRPNEVTDMIATIRKIRSDGTTVLLIEHVMRAVMTLCDRILVMVEGKALVEGSPQAVAHDPMVIKAYLGSSRAAKEAQTYA